MAKKINSANLLDTALSLCLYGLPIVFLLIFLFICILPGTESDAFSIRTLGLMLSFPYAFALLICLFSFIAKRKDVDLRTYCYSVKYHWYRAFIILIGILLCYGAIELSLLDVFYDGPLNILRIILMFGAPILIASGTLMVIFEIED